MRRSTRFALPARSRGLALAAVATLAAVLGPVIIGPVSMASAHPRVQLAPTAPTDLTFRSTDNVEYLGRFPEHSGTAGGFPSDDGKIFYLTDPRGVYTYDTTDPASPDLVDSVALFQTTTGVALAQEDPDTNGKILLVDAAATPAGPSRLQVVNVSDPANLSVLSTVQVTDHTWTCVSGMDDAGQANSCAYAYGRTGHIVDLTDPAVPALLEASWRTAVGYGAGKTNNPYTHDLTEVRPGLLMSAGSTVILMDTANPAAPVRLTAIEQPDRFSSLGYHSAEWARGGLDDFLVLGTEIAPEGPTNLAGSDCEGENSVIETWDARAVTKALQSYKPGSGDTSMFSGVGFTKIDAYDAASRGLFIDGEAPSSLLYCAHWMEQHPDFADGGTLAVSYYDRGTRFVEVASDGRMTEIGWIVAAESYSGSPQWISDDIVYVMDYRRGMEIVRLLDRPATGTGGSDPDPVIPEAPLVILLPLVTVGLLGLATWSRRRRAYSAAIG